MSVRKAHNSGRNHLRNVVEYYQQIGQEKAQSVIDSITSSYAAEGQLVQAVLLACHLRLEHEVSLSLLPSPQLLVPPAQEAFHHFLTCPTWDLLALPHPRANSLPHQAASPQCLRAFRAAVRRASHPCLVRRVQALPVLAPARALGLPDHPEEELKGLHPRLGWHQGLLGRRLGWGISGDMI
ncbi:hypothetical protein ASPVEDRAFT_461603 [Aspergillus versicolor CBS 583.65]|uniref:U1-C C2H2-type zinc finger domain-containing protein n=1 Tax=Aspergillus versicolor CBS 583.65 TaxID=1036611 RepID=A0A1L9PAH4_ASPVE|nr:uncharacterized protein ASPVEDRAFT_461603 [Aspergillus versicolor CBS 583.65]OJI98475.1 hypothetical protein ASPVEDRAFT_461603 [Aspergillus versicolor CBS 583.65]